MAQQELATQQVTTPDVSPSVRSAGQLLRELTDLDKKLSAYPEQQKKLKEHSADIQKLIAEGKLDASQATSALESLRKTLTELKNLKLSGDTQGLIEQASNNQIFTKEIVIPIAHLGVRKEDVVFKYTSIESPRTTARGDFSLSSDGVRTWRDNLMDVSVTAEKGNLVLKVYRGFEGDIDFNIKGQSHKVTQRGGVFTSDVSGAPVIDTSKAFNSLTQLSSALAAAPSAVPEIKAPSAAPSATPEIKTPSAAPTQEKPLLIRSEVTGINITEVKPGTSLYTAMNRAQEAGIEVVLAKYNGTKDGDVVFELRKDNKTLGAQITVPRNYVSAGRDYFAERNARLEQGLNDALDDQRKGLEPGYTALSSRMERISALLTSDKVKTALGELEYTNRQTPAGAGNREMWQAALSSAPVREILGLDRNTRVALTPEILAKAHKQLELIEKSAKVLLDWSDRNSSNATAAYTGFESNFSMLPPARQEPVLGPSVRSNLERRETQPDITITRPNFSAPDFAPTFTDPILRRAESPVEMPNIVLPEEPALRREPAPFEPIESEPIQVPKNTTTIETLGLELRNAVPTRVSEEVVKKLGITASISHPELTVLPNGELSLSGINPDTLTPVHYRGTQEKLDLKPSDSRYDLIAGQWIKLESERAITPSSNQEARIPNGSIAGAILSKDPNVSVAAAFLTEYFEGTHTAKSHFSGTATDLNKLFYESSTQLEFLTSTNLSNQHFSQIVADVVRSKDGMIRIPAASLPEEYARLGDICICCRTSGAEPELLVFRSKSDAPFLKTLTDRMQSEGWSTTEAARKALLEAN